MWCLVSLYTYALYCMYVRIYIYVPAFVVVCVLSFTRRLCTYSSIFCIYIDTLKYMHMYTQHTHTHACVHAHTHTHAYTRNFAPALYYVYPLEHIFALFHMYFSYCVRKISFTFGTFTNSEVKSPAHIQPCW